MNFEVTLASRSLVSCVSEKGGGQVLNDNHPQYRFVDTHTVKQNDLIDVNQVILLAFHW